MSSIIKKYGQLISKSVDNNPDRALKLLIAGYDLNKLKLTIVSDKKLSTHQRYISVLSNKSINKPLKNPETSAIVSMFAPCEMLHAVGISPQFTEGLACYLNGINTQEIFINKAEQYGVPKTYCSYHKILIGAVVSNVVPKPKMIINTTLACDANNTTFRTLSDKWHIPHFTIDIPGRKNEDALDYVKSQLLSLKDFLSQNSKETFSEDKLKEIIKCENESIALYRECFELLSVKSISNDMTSEMYKIFSTHILMGTKEAKKYFEILKDDLIKAPLKGDATRILWVHSLPFWQESLKVFLNHNPSIELLACDLNFDMIVEMDESDPYAAIANKLLSNTMGGENKRRSNKLLEMANYLKADGIVYFCQWGCKHTLGGANETKQILEKSGYPTLILDGDGCDSSNVNDGQMVTKFAAFIEILERENG